MTTPIPTGDQVAPLGVAGLLPDEATLNRLAGEFFAALPGMPAGSALQFGPDGPAVVSGVPAAGVTPGGIEHAPRVDVPATASGVPRAPGSLDAVGSGIDQTDPAAAMGLAPGGSVPDLTRVTDTVSSAAGVGGLPAPENPVIPGITGLHLAGPGELTPGMPGLSSPLPSAGVPGMPASDQVVAWVGLPGGSPDPTVVSSAPAALPTAGPPDVPFGIPGGGIGTPDTPAVPSVSGVRGATGFPSPAVPDVTNPAGVGLTSPLPVDGVPALPAGDPGFTGRGLRLFHQI